jgi:predicted porin
MNAAATLNPTTPGGKADVDTFFAGAVYRFTPTLSANFGWYQVKDKTTTNGSNDVRMAATGLTWSPYKEWDFFVDYATAHRRKNANAAFSIYDAWRPDTNSTSLAAGTKNQSGISIGALFKF